MSVAMAKSFKERREASMKKRSSNRTNSAALLAENGIAFETKKNGAHLVISHDGAVWNLWPGTGLVELRGSGKYERIGVFGLLKKLKGADCDS